MINLVLRFFGLLLIVTSCRKEETISPSMVAVYPNPFPDKVTVEVIASDHYSISIMDKKRNAVRSLSGDAPGGAFEFDFSDRRQEAFLAEVNVDGKRYVYELFCTGK